MKFNKKYLKEFVFEQKCVPWRAKLFLFSLLKKYIPIRLRAISFEFTNKYLNFYTKSRHYLNIWCLTKLNKKLPLVDNAINELQGYFGYSKNIIKYLLFNSEKIFSDEWNTYFKNKDLDQNSIIEFYDKTQNEIFELMNWHYINFLNGPFQYVFALKVALNNKFTDYLDYGSGIGTGGILFALNNFRVSLADISSQNLNFCRYRFRVRKIRAEFIDLKTQQIQNKGYDIITCFDVLEHTWDPLKIVNIMRDALKDDGLLIINTPFGKNDEKPMHIVKDKKISEKIKSIGFYYEWPLIEKCKNDIGRQILILKKRN